MSKWYCGKQTTMDNYAMWNQGDIIGGFLLVMSNLALLPAIWISACRGDHASAVIFMGTFFASVFYHSCRAFEVCIYDYERHKITDYIFVYRAIVWTITSMGLKRKGTLDFRLHVFVFFVLTDIVYAVVLYSPDSVLLPIFGIGLPFATMVAYSRMFNTKIFYNKPWTVASFVLAAIACLFMFFFPAEDYSIAHTLWHVFSMLSAYTFLLATHPCTTDGLQHTLEKNEY